MRARRTLGRCGSRPMQFLVVALMAIAYPTIALSGTMITLSGTVSYTGSHAADSVHIVAIDTATENAVALDVTALGAAMFSVPYALTFENAGVVGPIFIASVLDLDGTGISLAGINNDTVDLNNDVIGWYDGQQVVQYVSSASSQGSLDFALPTGEIHGTVTFAKGQTFAGVACCADPFAAKGPCDLFYDASTTTTYQFFGVYPGTWYVWADEEGTFGATCYMDPTCSSPGPPSITISAGQILNEIDLDFMTSPVEPSSWGRIKGTYR